MPVPASIDDLSTTAGSNSPAGSETPTEGDNYIRTLSSFIALLRDKLDGTSNTGVIQNATFSGTMAGAASWAALQSFAAGISVSSSSGNVLSGTYTPTTTAVSNVTSVSPNGLFKYVRVQNTVNVTGRLTITTTSTGSTTVGISLPVASNFTLSTDLAGVANQGRFGDVYVMLGISADTTNDWANLAFDTQSGGAGRDFYVDFTYEVK